MNLTERARGDTPGTCSYRTVQASAGWPEGAVYAYRILLYACGRPYRFGKIPYNVKPQSAILSKSYVSIIRNTWGYVFFFTFLYNAQYAVRK